MCKKRFLNVIEAFNSTSSHLDDLLRFEFGHVSVQLKRVMSEMILTIYNSVKFTFKVWHVHWTPYYMYDVNEFNNMNKWLTAKLLKQG